MKMARMPAHLRDLDSAYGLDTFRKAAEWFDRHGVSVAYVPRRGWRFLCGGRADGPTYIACWVGLGALVDMLDAPTATLQAIWDHGGAVKGFKPSQPTGGTI